MQNANPINVTQIDHVVLRAKNIDALIEFYCDVLGCRLERGPETLGIAQLRAGWSLIDIVDADSDFGKQGGGLPDHSAPNMDHMCLLVEPWETKTIEAQLQAHDVKYGEVSIRYGATGRGPSIYLTDPEGNTVELKGRTS